MVLPFDVVQDEDITMHFMSYKGQAKHSRLHFNWLHCCKQLGRFISVTMNCICSIALLLVALWCVDARTNGGPRPISRRVNPKRDATIQEVVICNLNIIE